MSHRFTVDKDGQVADRASPGERDAELKTLDESAFRMWEQKNGPNLLKLGLFLIIFAVICFVEGSDSRGSPGFWKWVVVGFFLAALGIPVTIYAGRIMFREL